MGKLITLSLFIRIRQGRRWWKPPIWPISYCWKLFHLGVLRPEGELAPAVGRARRRAVFPRGPSLRPASRQGEAVSFPSSSRNRGLQRLGREGNRRERARYGGGRRARGKQQEEAGFCLCLSGLTPEPRRARRSRHTPPVLAAGPGGRPARRGGAGAHIGHAQGA